MLKMCRLLILVALITPSLGIQVKTWNFNELSRVVESKLKTWNPIGPGPQIDAKVQPLVDAFNEIMLALFTGKNNNVMALMRSPTGGQVWTKEQLKTAMNDPEADTDLVPFINQAYQMMQQNEAANMNTVEVHVPALDISTWTVQEIQHAIQNPKTKKNLVPYLVDAAKKANENNQETATIITPVGLVPNECKYPVIFNKD